MIQHNKLLFVAVISLSILGCFRGMAQDTGTFSLLANLKAGFDSWDAQLDFIHQGGYNEVLDSSDLRLVSFTAVEAGEHPTLEKFKEMPVTIIGRSNDSGIPVVQKIREKWRGAKFYHALKTGIVNYYDSLEVDPGLRLVQLEWKYQDTTFRTYCVVSETLDVFIYDDILSNIFIVTKSRGSDVLFQKEDISGVRDNYMFREVLTIESPIGSTLAYTSTSIKVERKKDGDDLAIIDYSYDNKSESMPFWEATAKSDWYLSKKGKMGTLILLMN